MPQRGAVTIETLHGGDILGWSWLFPPYRTIFDARALGVVRTLAFDARLPAREVRAGPAARLHADAALRRGHGGAPPGDAAAAARRLWPGPRSLSAPARRARWCRCPTASRGAGARPTTRGRSSSSRTATPRWDRSRLGSSRCSTPSARARCRSRSARCRSSTRSAPSAPSAPRSATRAAATSSACAARSARLAGRGGRGRRRRRAHRRDRPRAAAAGRPPPARAPRALRQRRRALRRPVARGAALHRGARALARALRRRGRRRRRPGRRRLARARRRGHDARAAARTSTRTTPSR